MKIAILIGAAGFLSTAALAQTMTQYYVVHDPAMKKCTIVTQKPTSGTTTVVGEGKIYRTETEAETAMKTIKVCTAM
jgi:hypothetical protein